MPFPSKTDKKTILKTAVEIVENDGFEGLSIREVAKRLNLTPNALYHHISNREELESEIAAEGLRRLYKAMKEAQGKKTEIAASHEIYWAYLEFAKENSELYKLMIKKHKPTEGLIEINAKFKEFGRNAFSWLNSEKIIEEAQTAFFAMLHGFAMLEINDAFEPGLKPDPIAGLDALWIGFQHLNSNEK